MRASVETHRARREELERALAQTESECTELVRENDPGTSQYDWFFSPDGRQLALATRSIGFCLKGARLAD